MAKAIIMTRKDNVATLLAHVESGGTVEVTSTSGEVTARIKAKQSIQFGHKIAVKRIEKGERVLKYGEAIGETTVPIELGEHVHVHNLQSMTWVKFT